MDAVKQIRSELLAAGRRIASESLVIGPGGNISARLKSAPHIIYMKASGLCMEDMKPEEYIAMDLKTRKPEKAARKPTCEYEMHCRCYERSPEINAVIHTHPAFCTAYAVSGKTLKAFTPDFAAYIGREVPVLPYVAPGGLELADAAAKMIKKYPAVLLMNHGLVTTGRSLKEALLRTRIIENAVKVLYISRTFGKICFFNTNQSDAVSAMPAEKYRRGLL